VDSPSDVDDCYRVDLVNMSIEDNALKEAPLIGQEASIIHPVDVEEKKDMGDINVVEPPQYSSISNLPIEVMEPPLSSSSQHKPHKKDTKK
ncbi:hypothetical protein TorRG33x02_042220, partial [Trema orientale]